MKPVRVLLIDDSMTMRRLIRLALSADPRIEVVGEARDTRQATEKIAELRPDVLTLDVEMPGESGLAFLERLMSVRPMPVVMVSTETHNGSAAAIEALSLGAVECVGKPVNASAAADFAMLCDQVVAAASARVRPRPRGAAPAAPAGTPPPTGFIWNGRFVLIGSSTGGVEALEKILSGFPVNCPPTVITQHMPAGFLANFAQRMNTRLPIKVQLATTGAPLLPGHVFIAPGGDTHLTVTMPRSPVCQLVEGERRSAHRPSVDVLFESGAALADRAVAVMLTGMGRDGAEGMLKMRQAGAVCLAQDEESSVVWGMPRVAHEMGAVQKIVSLNAMAGEILTAAGRTMRSAG